MSAAALVEDLGALTPQQPATVAWRVVELDALLRRGLPSGAGLDVGCGDGTVVEVLPRHGAPPWRLVGVDPRKTQLVQRTGLFERVHTVTAAAVPERDTGFDFALSNSVLDRAGYEAGTDRRLAHVNLWSAQRWRDELAAVGLELEVAEP